MLSVPARRSRHGIEKAHLTASLAKLGFIAFPGQHMEVMFLNIGMLGMRPNEVILAVTRPAGGPRESSAMLCLPMRFEARRHRSLPCLGKWCRELNRCPTARKNSTCEARLRASSKAGSNGTRLLLVEALLLDSPRSCQKNLAIRAGGNRRAL